MRIIRSQEHEDERIYIAPPAPSRNWKARRVHWPTFIAVTLILALTASFIAWIAFQMGRALLELLAR